MPTLSQFTSPRADLPADKSADDDEIRAQVWGLLSTLYPKITLVERRCETRYPFPFLIYLTPADDADAPGGESIVVVGKHVSERGLGFYHPKPLPHRRVIASLERPHDGWYAFLLDLRWCRFTRQGWYESGGRFLEAVSPPPGKP
jgi:hypothetical protein